MKNALKLTALLAVFASAGMQAEESLQRSQASIVSVQNLVKEFEESDRGHEIKGTFPISVIIRQDDIIFMCQGTKSFVAVKNRGYRPSQNSYVITIGDKLQRTMAENAEKLGNELDAHGGYATIHLDFKGCVAKGTCTNDCTMDDKYYEVANLIMIDTMSRMSRSDRNLILISETEEEYASCLKLGLSFIQSRQEWQAVCRIYNM